MNHFAFDIAADSTYRRKNNFETARDASKQRSTSCPNVVGSERRNVRLSASAVETLQAWLKDHAEHPYVSKEVLDTLESSTGLTKSQIRGWFANARRRERSRSRSKGVDVSSRWKSRDIFDSTAIATNPMALSSFTSLTENTIGPILQDGDLGFARLRSSSIESRGSARSSDSEGTWLSNTHKRRRRRGRSRSELGQTSVSRTTTTDSTRVYQCTFCTGSFATKYDWQRHEKTSHITLEKWICCPFGTFRESTAGNEELCMFCPLPMSDGHICDHKFHHCQAKPPYERTFYRKDHFVQHLRLFHSATYQPHMLSWKEHLSELNSRCGFCGFQMNTWHGRVDHLACHFREGATMSQWQGSWGFDKHVEETVLNAIQPHLIDLECRAMNPFVAPSLEDLFGLEDGMSFEQAISGTDSYSVRGANTWYGWLSSELGRFVEQQKMFGLTVTDDDLRCQARIITYEDLDPWNWTLADDDVWLNNFKIGHGLLNLDGLSLG